MFSGFLFFFILGAIVGSFINVVVFRYGSRSLVSNRSMCGSCGKTLGAFELIPLASFIFQRGRCLGCKSRISWQYLLVELLTALVFTSVFYKYFSTSGPFLLTTYYLLLTDLLIWSLLIALSLYDLRHKIIPDAFVYGFAALALLSLLLKWQFLGGAFPLSDLLGGPLLALPFALLWFFSHGRAIGLGDAKLVLGFPWLVGIFLGLSGVFIGIWIGASVALFMILLKAITTVTARTTFSGLRRRLKDLTMRSELPLAPFLVLGLLIVYLTGIDVTGLPILISNI